MMNVLREDDILAWVEPSSWLAKLNDLIGCLPGVSKVEWNWLIYYITLTT